MAFKLSNSLFLVLKDEPQKATRNAILCASTAPMRERRPQNVEGEFFVDHRCIDCDTCRWMAPENFARVDNQSAVTKQPSCQEERLKSLQALLSCPTSSIHTEKPPKEIKEVQNTFPLHINEQSLPGVYHTGYHSERAYGAASYLIVHPEGNILVDSPRYTQALVKKIEELGGVSYMFLTHKDDVADHELWTKHFKCERILHATDVVPGTAGVERKLQGEGPWSIGTSTDLELIYTPGHTQGCVTLYYKPKNVIFTGDHFSNSYENELTIHEVYNQLSIPMQLESVEKFLDLDFKWILPGHGRRVQFKDNQDKNSKIKAFLASKAANRYAIK